MRIVAAVGLVIALAGPAASGQGGRSTSVFRSPVDMVPVFVTVTDANNRLVADLDRADFRLLDDGAPQPIIVFDNGPRPLRLVLLLDVSASMAPNLPLLREGSEAVFKRLRPGDAVRLGTFGRTVAIAPAFSSDVDALRAALPLEIDRRALTPLWKAVDQAMIALEDADSRPVVIVFSDGRDSGPSPGDRAIGLADVVNRARRDGIMVYAVGLHSRGGSVSSPNGMASFMTRDDRPDPGLSRLAAQTGGRYFEVDIDPERDLGTAFAAAMDELHSQYLLGFTPPHDGQVHTIGVSVIRPDLTIRARGSYEAPKPQAP
jgi:VWFA-related protein